jgi:dienelactone hydrolase
MILQEPNFPTSQRQRRDANSRFRARCAGEISRHRVVERDFSEHRTDCAHSGVARGPRFVVARAEIYHEYLEPGLALPYDEAGGARGNELKTTKPLQNYDSDARVGLIFAGSPQLQRQTRHDGSCIGGHLAFRTAFNSDVLAGICFYGTDIHKRGLGAGMNDDSLERMREPRAKC